MNIIKKGILQLQYIICNSVAYIWIADLFDYPTGLVGFLKGLFGCTRGSDLDVLVVVDRSVA